LQIILYCEYFMSNYTLIIAYGFSHECRIWSVNTRPYNAIFCMTVDTHQPFFASAHAIIGETAMSNISEKIKEIEETCPNELRKIDQMARLRLETASWRMVYYNKEGAYKEMDVGYESEGDENGDPR
jgi:hypothetical protein